MAKVIQVGDSIKVTELATIADLRTRIKAYTVLFGVAPRLTVEGWFACAKSNDPVHLNRDYPAKVYPKTIAINLNSEGVAHVGREDIGRVTVWLRAPSCDHCGQTGTDCAERHVRGRSCA